MLFLIAASSSTPTQLTLSVLATEKPSSPVQEARESLDYYVGRTPKGQNLGLYEERKRGGNYRQTVLKNLDGNIQKLKVELKEIMGVEEDHIRCNMVTKKIIIKGYRAQEIKTILEGKGF